MPDLAFALGLRLTQTSPCKAVTPHSPQVLKRINLITLRINTYSVVRAALKTRHFYSFRINTYRKSPANPLYNEHLQKNLGGWGTRSAYSPIFRLLHSAFSPFSDWGLEITQLPASNLLHREWLKTTRPAGFQPPAFSEHPRRPAKSAAYLSPYQSLTNTVTNNASWHRACPRDRRLSLRGAL